MPLDRAIIAVSRIRAVERPLGFCLVSAG